MGDENMPDYFWVGARFAMPQYQKDDGQIVTPILIHHSSVRRMNNRQKRTFDLIKVGKVKSISEFSQPKGNRKRRTSKIKENGKI
jgi:hypothetical protein